MELGLTTLEKSVMIKAIGRFLVMAAILLAGAGPQAQIPGGDDEIKTSAEIHIELPAARGAGVTVVPGDSSVLIELPRGSIFPLEFASSSNGLLRGGEVKPLGDDRLELHLDLALGLLDRIVYQPDSMVLVFTSRYEIEGHTGSTGEQYLLGPDDKLLITVQNHPELTSHPTITGEGTINIPLLGDVKATGYTPRRFAQRLSELLGRSYLVDPQIDVEVEEYRSQWVVVTGEVRTPRRISLKGGTRLKEVLAEAGGFGENSGEIIAISRRLESSGEYTALIVDRAEFESGTNNPVLRHGDIVDVGRSAWCYLQGEVRLPGRVRIERGMTLLRAIALSGGMTEWADRKQVKVLYAPGTQPQERIFNLKSIVAGKSSDPELRGGEVVVINRRFF
jgi:polysaccharide export outer membrane protein